MLNIFINDSIYLLSDLVPVESVKVEETELQRIRSKSDATPLSPLRFPNKNRKLIARRGRRVGLVMRNTLSAVRRPHGAHLLTHSQFYASKIRAFVGRVDAIVRARAPIMQGLRLGERHRSSLNRSLEELTDCCGSEAFAGSGVM